MEQKDQERPNHHGSNNVKNLDAVAAIAVSYHSEDTILKQTLRKKVNYLKNSTY